MICAKYNTFIIPGCFKYARFITKEIIPVKFLLKRDIKNAPHLAIDLTCKSDFGTAEIWRSPTLFII